MKVEIKKSKRRKKTLSARLEGETMYVYVPHNIKEAELKRAVDNFKKRFKKRKLKRKINAEENLPSVAARLNRKYFGRVVKIKSIQYVTNQNTIFASCTVGRGTIRISHRVSKMPAWVRDFVIVHEMAHILAPGHGRKFRKLVNRYELAERARGYLMAKGMQGPGRDID